MVPGGNPPVRHGGEWWLCIPKTPSRLCVIARAVSRDGSEFGRDRVWQSVRGHAPWLYPAFPSSCPARAHHGRPADRPTGAGMRSPDPRVRKGFGAGSEANGSVNRFAVENREVESPRRFRAISGYPRGSLVDAPSECSAGCPDPALANPSTTYGYRPTPAAHVTGV
jgi:hypothetical protein